MSVHAASTVDTNSPINPNFRNRRFPAAWPDSNASPTSSTISSTPTRMPLRTAPSSTIGTPNRRIVIKVDPVMVSCFDSNDKELYELWAPTR
ncbi:hypothetical protein BD410DRAFT_780038 [Rickenella mellea]|uniref:Uncharacterized protein n=1 Tax=Rickenella mellea TaxID=50990 RepID=A0A4R5XEN3_9AGAM|nr:hypothetical protein BD410DRAFT_780038 [Rickenella mellea]